MAEKKEKEMRRREFLFKAAEAAALALFGSMGLAEVLKVVVKELRERSAANQLASQIVQNLIISRVEKCMQGKKFECEAYQERVDCGYFNCNQVFTCIAGDFSCEQPHLFSCVNYQRFRCYGYIG